MKITTKITWSMTTGEVLDHQFVEYYGTVELCKGADVANSQRQTELAMQQQAFSEQMAQLQKLNAAFQKYMQGPGIGFDPQTLALMRTQFLNSNASTFQSAGQQVRSALGARGAGTGQMPVGGDYVRGIASLMGAQAQSQAQGLNQINLQNALQSITNRFNAGNLLSGNAATLTGTQGVAGYGASSALNDYIKAANSGFGSAFAQGFGGALGKTLGSFGVSSGPGGTTSTFGV